MLSFCDGITTSGLPKKAESRDDVIGILSIYQYITLRDILNDDTETTPLDVLYR